MVPRRFLVFALLVGCLASAAPVQAVDLPVLDSDGDRIPQVVEGNLCGRRLLANLVVNTLAYPYLGHCGSWGDWTPPGPATFGDTDGDALPQYAEPLLCKLQNEHDPLDGTCTSDDFHPPL